MSTYPEIITALQARIAAQQDTLSLKNQDCRSQVFLHPQPTAQVCLFFHGFTAAPYQFVPIGQAFFQAGCNVVIPLLPGHGLAGDWQDDNPPPLPTDPKTYQQFAIDWFHQAQMLGEKVIVGGLSGGGTMSAWLALERPWDIHRALLFAPYLSGTNRLVDLFVKMFNSYFRWRYEPGQVPIGYTGFRLPALRVFLEMGQEILTRAEQEPTAPLFIFSSQRDKAVNSNDHKTLFQLSLKQQPLSWYHCFDHRLDVPHNMMTIREGNPHRDLLIALAKAYVESNLTWADLQTIRDRRAQGEPFDQILGELKLNAQVSPGLPLIMSLLNS